MRYTVIGGLNGVGKSTAYSTLSDNEMQMLGKRINVDEIVSSIGDWRDAKVQYMAGKQAVKEIKECLKAGVDFHQETTLSGRTVLNTIKKARARGYSIHLWYIYVATVDIAKERVLARVKNGGHGIPEDIIERRSITSVVGFKNILQYCNEIRVFDNTLAFNPVASVMNGEVVYLDKSVPQGIVDILGGVCPPEHVAIRRASRYGAWEGTYSLPEDFNAPLDNFREYM